MEENKISKTRPSSHKRSIQPQQQKSKGVTRIINGPKKNAIVKRVNNKEKATPKSTENLKSEDKNMNVYDRLYNSRPSKEHKKLNSSQNKTPKKINKNSNMSGNAKQSTILLTDKKSKKSKSKNHDKMSLKGTKSFKDYTGYVSLDHRSRTNNANQFFSLSSDSKKEIGPRGKKRQPTPVVPKDQSLSQIEGITNHFEIKSAPKSNLSDNEHRLTKLNSDNPS